MYYLVKTPKMQRLNFRYFASFEKRWPAGYHMDLLCAMCILAIVKRNLLLIMENCAHYDPEASGHAK